MHLSNKRESAEMKRITYSAKYYIFDSILTVLGLTFSIIALFVLDESAHWLIWVFYGIFAVISLFQLLDLLWNIQWIRIDNNNICAYNIFGMIKKIDISKIQTVKVINARAWGVRMYSKYYSCIAISSRKRINSCDIQNSYNHRKGYYIIFPNTYSNLQKLKDAYEKTVGKELEI